MAEAKTKSMIFNFSKNHQFTSRFVIDDEKIELVKEAKLLGTVITDDLKWSEKHKRNSEERISKNAVIECSCKFHLKYL